VIAEALSEIEKLEKSMNETRAKVSDIAGLLNKCFYTELSLSSALLSGRF